MKIGRLSSTDTWFQHGGIWSLLYSKYEVVLFNFQKDNLSIYLSDMKVVRVATSSLQIHTKLLTLVYSDYNTRHLTFLRRLDTQWVFREKRATFYDFLFAIFENQAIFVKRFSLKRNTLLRKESYSVVLEKTLFK